MKATDRSTQSDDARPTPTRAPEHTPRGYSKHGLNVLKGAVKGLGGRVIDRRTSLGRALAQWRTELINDLGGPGAVSTQEAAVVDLAVRTKLLLDSIDAWLLTQRSLINRKQRALLPAILQRQQLADGLARYLSQLGLKRRKPPTKSLEQYVTDRYGTDPQGDGDKQ
jgi:hypothetical protein